MKTLWTIAVILMIGMAYLGGFASHAALNPPDVIEKPYPVVEYRTVNVTQYVDRWHELEVIMETVTVNNTIVEEKIVYEDRYIVPKHFESLDDLNKFLEYYREHQRIVFVADGTNTLDSISGNCKEMALDLQQMAARQGYDFPTETLTRTEMRIIYGEATGYHRINKAWIPGLGEWYYDFATDKLWQAW